MVLRGVTRSPDSWSSTGVTEDRRQTLFACVTACAVALALLARPLQHLDAAVWGPSDPWNNGDFLGAHWLFWAIQQPGDAAAGLFWPWGELDAWTSFPNPFDAWILSGVTARAGFPPDERQAGAMQTSARQEALPAPRPLQSRWPRAR